jgi:hypothetical protein
MDGLDTTQINAHQQQLLCWLCFVCLLNVQTSKLLDSSKCTAADGLCWDVCCLQHNTHHVASCRLFGCCSTCLQHL